MDNKLLVSARSLCSLPLSTCMFTKWKHCAQNKATLRTLADRKARAHVHHPTRRSLTTGWRLSLSLWQVQGKNSMREDGCNGPSGCEVVKTPRARFPAGSGSGFGPVGEGWTTKRSWEDHAGVATRQCGGQATRPWRRATPRRDRAPTFGSAATDSRGEQTPGGAEEPRQRGTSETSGGAKAGNGGRLV